MTNEISINPENSTDTEENINNYPILNLEDASDDASKEIETNNDVVIYEDVQQENTLIVNAGEDSENFYRNKITLGGNPTASGGTGIYKYEWKTLNAYNDRLIPLDQKYLANPTFNLNLLQVNYPVDLKFEVTVTDSDGNIKKDEVNVKVFENMFDKNEVSINASDILLTGKKGEKFKYKSSVTLPKNIKYVNDLVFIRRSPLETSKMDDPIIFIDGKKIEYEKNITSSNISYKISDKVLIDESAGKTMTIVMDGELVEDLTKPIFIMDSIKIGTQTFLINTCIREDIDKILDGQKVIVDKPDRILIETKDEPVYIYKAKVTFPNNMQKVDKVNINFAGTYVVLIEDFKVLLDGESLDGVTLEKEYKDLFVNGNYVTEDKNVIKNLEGKTVDVEVTINFKYGLGKAQRVSLIAGINTQSNLAGGGLDVARYYGRGNLVVEKINEMGEKLPGAEFEITGENLDEPIKIITKEDGTGKVENLKEGKYILKEIRAPKGYILDKTPIELEISKDTVWYENIQIMLKKQVINKKEIILPPVTPPEEDKEDEVVPPVIQPEEDKEDEAVPPVTPPEEDKEDEVVPPVTPPEEDKENEVVPPVTLPEEGKENEVAPPVTPPEKDKETIHIGKEQTKVKETNTPNTSDDVIDDEILILTYAMFALFLIYFHNKKNRSNE